MPDRQGTRGRWNAPGEGSVARSAARGDASQIAELRRRLEEAEETIRAIRDGEVDAFVMRHAGEEDVFALEMASDPYRRLVERMHQGAVTIGPDGAIFFCNQRFAEMLRLTPELTYGRTFRSYVSEGDRRLWDALVREAAERDASHGEIGLRSPDASDGVPVHVSLAPFGNGGVGFSVMVTDVTDRKKHEAVLASETLSKSIFEQAADAIVVCDGEGTVIRTSRGAQELCRSNPMLLSFDTAFELNVSSAGGEGERSRFSIEQVLEGKTIRGLEVWLLRKEGAIAHLLLSAAPVRKDAATIGCVVTLTDITAQKQAEKVLRQSDRRKDEFLAVLGHEIRNALGPVRNASQILDRGDATELDVLAARAMLDRQVTHMTRLIEDLLDVSRIAQGKVLLRKEPIDLGALLRTVVEDCKSTLDAAGLSLELSVPSAPIWTAGDPVRLSQVLGNLLQNAAKFTDAGGKVSVVAEASNGNAIISVSDTGIGMSAETAASVFDFFSQSESSRDRSRGGLGLGLALARGLVELHGGRLRAESDGPGRGSRFTAVLPLQGASELTAPNEARNKAERRPLRILVVEDNADMAESLAILLRLEGHAVDRARTGEAGLELARSLLPDVVLCDLGLPGAVDGYSVAEELRKNPGTSRACLIAVTGYADEDARSRSASAGFDYHLNKPVSLEAIDRVLDSVTPE